MKIYTVGDKKFIVYENKLYSEAQMDSTGFQLPDANFSDMAPRPLIKKIERKDIIFSKRPEPEDHLFHFQKAKKKKKVFHEKSSRKTLSLNEQAELLDEVAKKEKTIAKIAEDYGVSESYVYLIKKRKADTGALRTPKVKEVSNKKRNFACTCGKAFQARYAGEEIINCPDCNEEIEFEMGEEV